MKAFYTTEKGKEVPHKFTKGEYEEYVEVCGMIWGGLPLDLTWSRSTGIYKEALKKRNEKYGFSGDATLINILHAVEQQDLRLN